MSAGAWLSRVGRSPAFSPSNQRVSEATWVSSSLMRARAREPCVVCCIYVLGFFHFMLLFVFFDVCSRHFVSLLDFRVHCYSPPFPCLTGVGRGNWGH